jgi:predicted restriction endonuclease
MFDRGLISIGDDYKILIAKNHVPEDAIRLLNQNGSINPAQRSNALSKSSLSEISQRRGFQKVAAVWLCDGNS